MDLRNNLKLLQFLVSPNKKYQSSCNFLISKLRENKMTAVRHTNLYSP